MNKQTLSICIPIYKRPDLLKICLSSIIKQVDPKWVTLIVIDDSVSDINKDVIDWAVDSFSNFLYIRNEYNLGIDANIEYSLNIANTDYVWVIGEDDILLNGAIDILKQVLNNNAYDYIFANYLYLNNDYSASFGHATDLGGDINCTKFIENYLWAAGFIGANIYSTKALLINKNRYLGTYFNHVGRLVDILEKNNFIYIIQDPLVGNRADDISSFSWTDKFYHVLFGFESLMMEQSKTSKLGKSLFNATYVFRNKFGYVEFMRVMSMRGYGIYNRTIFELFFAKEFRGWNRLVYKLIAILPSFVFIPVKYFFIYARKIKRVVLSSSYTSK